MTRQALSIRGEGLQQRFKRGTFSLDVPAVEASAGQTLAVLGPSGSGKTTLLRLLGLLEPPAAGKVYLDGRAVSPHDATARNAMAAVFQRPYLFKGSVGANVGYGLSVRRVPKTERATRVATALERVGLTGYETRSALSLSGGEAQRVSLARALVLEPQVLLLDEPLASLDPLLKRRLTHDFATILRSEGVTVVYVTHDQDEALVVADRIVIMNAGRIVASGTAEEIVGIAEDEWTAAFLGVEPASTGRVTSSREGLAEVTSAGVVVTMAGELPVGADVRFAVRPEDVLLFETGVELPLTTARNRIEATVVALEPRGSTLRATLQSSGVRFASSVSRAAAAELRLQTGTHVLAVFKATAVKWRLIDEHQESLQENEPIIDA